jgi:hypothetical protein
MLPILTTILSRRKTPHYLDLVLLLLKKNSTTLLPEGQGKAETNKTIIKDG